MDFGNILFPVDFSNRSSAARPFAAALTEKFNARLTLLHVLQTPGDSHASALEKLNAFAATPEIETVVMQGDPSHEIAAFVKTHDVDLVVMPTHGHGKFRSLLLGSVASKVLHDVACPIWTTAHTEDQGLTRHVDCHRILCAVDLHPESAGEIHRAMHLAHYYHAEIKLVHAVPTASCTADPMFDTDLQRSLLSAGRNAMARLQKEAGTDFDAVVAAGSVADVVHSAALSFDADLVIVGHGHLHDHFGRLLTHVYSIIKSAPCPVLSF